MHLSVKYASTWYCHTGPWTWGLRWVDVPFLILMCLSWKLCGDAVDVPFGDLMGLRAPARTKRSLQELFFRKKTHKPV